MTIYTMPVMVMSRADTAVLMAEIQTQVFKATYNASSKQVIDYFTADGASTTAVEGILLNWLEIKFPALAGRMNVGESSGHIMLHISGTDFEGESYRLMGDLPSSLRYVLEEAC